MSVSRYKDEVNQKVVKEIYSRSSPTGQCVIEIHKKSLQLGVLVGGGAEGMVIACWDWAYGMCQKKAYISKTTEPNSKNEYVLESAWTGASTWR